MLALCGKAARTDLCGGREVTRVPTATQTRVHHAPRWRGRSRRAQQGEAKEYKIAEALRDRIVARREEPQAMTATVQGGRAEMRPFESEAAA